MRQPFDLRAATGFVHAAATSGFGTFRGMLWRGEPPGTPINDGDELPGARGWFVIATPGHTDDHVSFWHPTTRTLLSGDAIITVNTRPVFAPGCVDGAAAAQTERRLRDLPIETLLPGHGKPVRNPWDR